jgi:predicted Fe-Mo cluster-binding NifX family protein
VAFVVDGIGTGALAELKQAGFKVFQARPGTVADNLERIARKELTELTVDRSNADLDRAPDNDDDNLPRFGCGF